MTRVLFPLKLKIISANVILLLITIVLLVQFASSLFNEDKSATIYEATLNNSLSYAERVKGFILQNKASIELLTDFSSQEDIDSIGMKKIFSNNPHLISFSYWPKGRPGDFKVYLENDLFLKQNIIASKELLNWDKKILLKIENGFSLDKSQDGKRWLLYKSQRGDSLSLARISLDDPLKKLSRDSQFKTYFQVNNTFLATDQAQSEVLTKSLESLVGQIPASGQVTKINGKKNGKVKNYLVAFQGITPSINIASAVEENSIFRASEFLRKQSLFFSLFIFSLTVMVGVLLSKNMTSGLARLHEATLSYAKGEFDNDVSVKSRDEIGSLAVTFKNMGKEILRYIEEMKDKARLEKEIEVAKLVQESFIPQNNKALNLLKLSSIYQPASECGGDWWGILEIEEKWILVVADATGHGVPAALLTATASGCLHNIEYSLKESKKNSGISAEGETIKPSEILKVLNFSIARMGGKINMTAFAMVLDSRTGEVCYSNASHNPPILIKGGLEEKEFSKADLEPLMGESGERLGEKLDSLYSDTSIKLEEGDLLFLFSDGLVEQADEEGKQWGNRNFYKALLGQLNNLTGVGLLESLPNSVFKEAQEFSGHRPWDDDVTLLCVGLSQGEFKKEALLKGELLDENDLLSMGMDNDEIYRDALSLYPLTSIFQDRERMSFYQRALDSGLSFQNINFPIERKTSFRVLNNKDIEKQIQVGLNELDFTGYFDSPKDPFAIIARELVSNAFYHQSTLTSDRERTGEFSVPEENGVEVLLAQGEKGLGIIVEDYSGRLKFEDFRSSLNRAYRERKPRQEGGGAGLGLLMIFENANQVLVEVTPGVKTKVMAIIEKEKRYKKYKQKNTDFIFRERSA